ncbi:hypothetical protein COC42_15320 [Sphingomonas spermidinifaciens]|uniref:Uncharacterized protein n=1 Tax=Sphingomonas spermidinifaciens TaxID=1141889 RepID=A0A2A4B508_9SPHN|nr:hypothetical protein [Sphingomonas spermidinifaciens]PCD02744.1 hypothetical protein COC42_15320 [Sphingomonas spermidinifaciens]
MFVNFNPDWPPPSEPPAQPPRPRLDRKAEVRLGWVIALNLAMLVLGPLAGATVLHALVAAFAG